MNPVRSVEGRMVPLWRADVDTDQIMPKQFLKRVERTGFGEFVFHDWLADPDFVLNDARYAGAKVLVAGANFGCGSSREHAPWGLQQWGFDAIIAPSFADIFRNNCAKIGLLTVELGVDDCKALADAAVHDPSAIVHVDLEGQRVRGPGVDAGFEIDPHTKHCLLEGLDDIGLTMRRADAIDAFEALRPSWLPATDEVAS